MRIESLKRFADIWTHLQFQNKAGYHIQVVGEGKNCKLFIYRTLTCSVTKEHVEICNYAKFTDENISDGDFIKLVFKLVGQFEAHEFIESFRYNGTQVYFPHSDKRAFALFDKGDHINDLILKPWDWIIKGTSPLSIALYFVGVWIDNTAYIKALDSMALKLRRTKPRIEKFVKLITVNCFILGLDLFDILYKKETMHEKYAESQNEATAA